MAVTGEANSEAFRMDAPRFFSVGAMLKLDISCMRVPVFVGISRCRFDSL